MAAVWVFRATVFGATGWLVLSCNASPTTETLEPEAACLVVSRCPIKSYDYDARPGCETPSDCPDGLTCDDLTQTSLWSSLCIPKMSCWPRCDCYGGDVCNAEGQCRPPRCDEPDAPPCPDHHRCDPLAAESDHGSALGSVVLDDANTRAHTRAAGCVRKRCNEVDGYACEGRYRCAPDETANLSGCVPRPCAETNLCSSEAFVCEPGGSHPRTRTDEFGCVGRTCDDPGFVCPTIWETISGTLSQIALSRACDYSSPEADELGCVTPACDASGGGCPAGFSCDPASSSPKASNGCVSVEGAEVPLPPGPCGSP